MSRPLLLRCLLLAALPMAALHTHANAQAPALPRTDVYGGVGKDALDRGYDDWTANFLGGQRRGADGSNAGILVRETERFGQSDQELQLNGALPLSPRWLLLLDGSASDTARVLPRYALQAGAARRLDDGWVASGALRLTAYRPPGGASSEVTLALFTVERYWGSWRAAGTAYRSRLDSGASAGTLRGQLDWFSARDSRVGVSYASGTELENLGPSAGVLRTDVRTLTLLGQWWFARGWALDWALERSQQGDLYLRRGWQLGLRYAL